MEPIYAIDKNLFKTMKYIYRNHGASLKSIRTKYGKSQLVAVLYLCPAHYAAYKAPGSSVLSYNVSSVVDEGMIYLTMLGNKYIEEHKIDAFRWIFTSIISLISLSVSVAAILVSTLLK